MIENPGLIVWQVFLIALVALIFLSAAWFLVRSFLRGSLRYRYGLIGIFVGIGTVATFECWLEGDRFLSQQYDQGDIPGWVGFISAPGIIADLLVFNRTDIPENDPDLWQTAWLVAPASALFWTALLLVIEKISLLVFKRFFTMSSL